MLFNYMPESELNVPITVEVEVSFSSKHSLMTSIIIEVHWTKSITGL